MKLNRNGIEDKLLSILRRRCVRRGDFTLSGGGASDVYIDMRLASMSDEAVGLIGKAVWRRIEKNHADALLPAIEAIGGMESGSIPIVTACMAQVRYIRLEGFFVRKERKTHGTESLIEGDLRAGMNVCLIDDVVTSGASLVRAMEAVREHGCTVVMALAIVDRLAGARELLASHGVERYDSVFTLDDFRESE